MFSTDSRKVASSIRKQALSMKEQASRLNVPSQKGHVTNLRSIKNY